MGAKLHIIFENITSFGGIFFVNRFLQQNDIPQLIDKEFDIRLTLHLATFNNMDRLRRKRSAVWHYFWVIGHFLAFYITNLLLPDFVLVADGDRRAYRVPKDGCKMTYNSGIMFSGFLHKTEILKIVHFLSFYE